jgi:hypothetical protein
MVLYKSRVIGIPARILWYMGTENYRNGIKLYM